jgi:hypothetical protein
VEKIAVLWFSMTFPAFVVEKEIKLNEHRLGIVDPSHPDIQICRAAFPSSLS